MENNMEASHKIKKGLVYNQQPHFWVYMQTEQDGYARERTALSWSLQHYSQ
jgi:hypothetical protein